MDHTSVVTYAGDMPLFDELETSLIQAIPKETTEWKRPYGRAVKSVNLNASFVPFSKDSVPKPGTWKLIAQPILHTYWTECSDVELYKSSTKGDIEDWLKRLNGADWMIILVEVYDIRKSNKLLPRTTVLDKIRSDFAGKQGDRVVSLIHPIKSESKSAESWRGLVNRLRHLLLAAYNKTLLAFEEAVRANRECRPQPTWSFCGYFTMQEELALVLEMLGLIEEALVQYDELDALFTQFVLNSMKGEMPKWLASFTVPLHKWAGPTLSQKVTASQRELLRNSKLDLLQFRSYLFGRQCSLLLRLSKPWEVAQRTVSFLHNCVQEMKILEVSSPDGALATWVFLVCLEILHACDKDTNSEHVQAYSLHTAGLWAYAREKLKQLGTLCGLVPGPGPTSDQLHTVVQLSSGMGDPPSNGNIPSPVDRLKEALSSKAAYNSYFLELSELAISTYKHIGRMRFARYIGLDLADLYLSLGQPDKAATFLSAAVDGAKDDGWNNLAARTQLKLVRCFSDSTSDVKYTMTCAAIASSDLPSDIKMDYYSKFLNSAKLFAQDTPMVTSLGDIGVIKSIKVDPRHQIRRGQCLVSAVLTFFSALPGSLHCEAISVSLEKGSTQSSQRKDDSQREIFQRVSVIEQVDYKQDGSLNAASIILPEGLKALRRTESAGRGRKNSTPLRKDFTLSLTTRNVVICPGNNVIELDWTATNVGRYVMGQLSLTLPGLELLEPVPQPAPELFVEQQKSSVELKINGELLAGLPRTLELVLETGSHYIIKDTPILISCSPGLQVLHPEREAQSTAEINLPETEPFEKITLPLSVFAELPAQSEEKTTIDHQITICCVWCDVETTTSLSFLTPLKSNMRLHSVGEGKLLQVVMSCLTGTKLILRNPKLLAKGVALKDRNSHHKNQLVIGAGLKGSLLWELDVNSLQTEMDSIDLTFSVEYSLHLSPHLDTTSTFYQFKHPLGIRDFKTLFIVKCHIEAGKESDFCRVGSMCQLTLVVSRCLVKDSSEVMYELHPDPSMWAMCGSGAGILPFDKEVEQSVTMELIPQTTGFLPLPNVRLCRYIHPSEKGEDSKARLEPFSSGEVYYASKSEQVHVLPAGAGSSD